MKFLTIIVLKILLWSNFLLAETIPTKSKILKQSNYCIKNPKIQLCKELVSQIENLQLVEFEQNRFKCQSSLLGLQSELIEAYYLESNSRKSILFMIPYVIKNC